MTKARRRNYASLSVKDLLDAREAYHVHLCHMANVVATAVGRYRFTAEDDESEETALGTRPRGRTQKRTLRNSEVRPYSWPCVMVFVSDWIEPKDFAARVDDIVPQRLYLPDGRVVPTCVIYAEKREERAGAVQTLRFPEMMLGGGYPSLADVQGQTRAATIGCLVSDGDLLYALTNAHVAGEAGRELYTLVGGKRELLGRSAGKEVGKLPFERAYPGFAGPRSVLNLDAALVRIESASRWTSRVFGIGQFGELADINAETASLDLVGCDVVAFGAASGKLAGEIQGLFYRYRSVGGQDQLADLLIGPREPSEKDADTPKNMARAIGSHGNSGAVWFLEADAPEKLLRPIALHWGGQSFVGAHDEEVTEYALASSLGVICRELGVDIVRDVRLGREERWGAVGHYTVGQVATRFPTDEKLATLLSNNRNRIFEDPDNPVDADDFTPLAMVPDLEWRELRGDFERPTHFADLDQRGPLHQNKTLLELSEDDDFFDPREWLGFYDSLNFDLKDGGSLPFRVWQLYDVMVGALKESPPNLVKFVTAAGVVTHYVGDACQPLHATRWHNGYGEERIPNGKGVHTAYESHMLSAHAADLNTTIDDILAQFMPSTRDISSGHACGRAILVLQKRTLNSLSPELIVDTFIDTEGDLDVMWSRLGRPTAERIIDGANVLASIWKSAWEKGGGPNLDESVLGAIDPAALSELYRTTSFARSVWITWMRREVDRLVIGPPQ
ncbi:MAG: hypothetical protein HOV80_25840 [Polyangiaceae bacterium]|nr:hypothetical protein [Polyangiaceae bacterium]